MIRHELSGDGDRVSRTLNSRFVLHEVIGSGAVGRVYRAYDLQLHRDVAVKRLRSDVLGGTEEQARFAREAVALARIAHPHVLAVFDVSSDPRDPYLVLSYCPDGSLADRLKIGALTPAAARDLARQVSSGLVAMHAAGVIHRDVKPSNILRQGDRWLIGDLGIARVDDHHTLTETGARIGTPQYWAPETARGEACTAAVDVYGLGCVLYEALTKQKVFRGDTAIATGLLHATAPAPPLPAAVERADPLLASLVLRMLAKDPSARPGAATIQRQLDPDLAAATTQRLAPPDDETIPVAVPPSMIDRTRIVVPAANRERRRPGVMIAVAAVLALGVAGAFAVIQSPDDTPPSEGAAAGQATTDPTAAPAATGRVVPDLDGRSVAAATAQLADRDLRLVVSGAAPASLASGLIIDQVPAARTSIPPGSVVSVVLSSGSAATLTQAAAPAAKPGKPSKPAKKDGHRKRGPKRP